MVFFTLDFCDVSLIDPEPFTNYTTLPWAGYVIEVFSGYAT